MAGVGGAVTLGGSFAQIVGGVMQMGNDVTTGSANLLAGSVNLLTGATVLRLGQAFAVSPSNYLARASNATVETNTALAGAAVDTLSGTFPDMSPQQASCQ